MTRKLLVICEPGDGSSAAVATAASLARSTEASVELRAFDHSEAIALLGLVDRAGMERARDAFVLKRRESVQRRADALCATGIKASADAHWCRPVHEEMLRRIEQLQPDLVIKDATYEPLLLKRMLFTPTDWHLMRQCPVPLLLVQAGARPVPKTIVAAVDPGPYAPNPVDLNHRILAAAQEMARAGGAELHLVFVQSPLTDVAAAIGITPASLSADAFTAMHEMRTKAFDALAPEHGVAVSHRHMIHGAVGPAIADFASRSSVDLIVVGTTHRRPLDRLVMGSGAEQIVDYAPCSVLVVPPGQAAPLPKM